jgi:hypothetical protein
MCPQTGKIQVEVEIRVPPDGTTALAVDAKIEGWLLRNNATERPAWMDTSSGVPTVDVATEFRMTGSVAAPKADTLVALSGELNRTAVLNPFGDVKLDEALNVALRQVNWRVPGLSCAPHCIKVVYRMPFHTQLMVIPLCVMGYLKLGCITQMVSSFVAQHTTCCTIDVPMYRCTRVLPVGTPALLCSPASICAGPMWLAGACVRMAVVIY